MSHYFTILLYRTGELKICIILTHVLVSFIDGHIINQLRVKSYNQLKCIHLSEQNKLLDLHYQ